MKAPLSVKLIVSTRTLNDDRCYHGQYCYTQQTEEYHSKFAR